MIRIDHDLTKSNRPRRYAHHTSRLAVIVMMFFLFNNGVAATFGKFEVSNKYTRHRSLGEKGYKTFRREQTPDSDLTAETTSLQDQIITSLHHLQYKKSSTTTLISLRGGSTVSRRGAQPSRVQNKKGGNRTPLNASRNGNSAAPTLSSSRDRRNLTIFMSSSFLAVLAIALVAFSPAPALVAEIGLDRATSTLSTIAACAALTEIIISPALGSLLDSIGRKPALVTAMICVASVHGLVSIHSSVVTICAAKFVGLLSLGSFFTATQVIISDVSMSDPTLMSSTLGLLYALIGSAFFVGAISAGRLSELGLSVTYGTSMVVCALNAALIAFGMRETLLPSKRIPFQENKTMLRKQLLQSPWSSCTRILTRHSKEVRILAILIMIQTLPSQMNDTFQIIARTEWNLDTKDFSSFVAVIGIFNIFANIAGSQMVVKLGIKFFTAIATLSSIIAPIGASFFSFRGLMAGTMIGCLGSAQMLGVTAALYVEGAKSHVPQGELAGERSAFLALTKVIGPIWYSMLYVKGKKVCGTGFLPFYFNIGCGLAAFAISQRYLPS